jgi:hypothetical protein
MSREPITQVVPHSVGTNRSSRALPPDACNSHLHISDPGV